MHIEAQSAMERWRPLVQWFLCIPHVLYTGLLAGASVIVAVVIGVVLLVTGRIPQRLAAFQVLTLRERVRCYSYFFVLRSSRPPYPTSISAVDPGDDPLVTVTVDTPTTAPRWSLVVRPLLAIPHLVLLLPIGLVMDACYPVWMVLASANGGWPEGMERTLIRVERWVAAVAMYLTYATNEVPRLGLAAYADGVEGTTDRAPA